MIALLKKVAKLFQKKSSALKITEHEKQNLILRSNKLSDIERWKKDEELFHDWNERTVLLGDFIDPNSNILEFGAGNMFLKKYLNNYNKYAASDIVQRTDETIVCDLNEPISIDLSVYNVLVFSGVLEYVYDIENVFKQFGDSINQVVLSYCCTDIVHLSRDKNGWLSDFKREELEEIFEKYNFKIQNYTEWRKQSIYNLKR